MVKKMKIADDSVLMCETAKMRQALTRSRYDANDLIKIFLATSVSEYFQQDASLGGYVSHKKKLQRKNFFI